MRVVVIGGGSWGTTVGSLASENTETILWCRNPDVAEEINRRHTNKKYLADLKLHPQLSATTELSSALQDAEMIVMAVPSYAFRPVLEQIAGFIKGGQPVFSLTKGLEQATYLRMTQVIKDVLPAHPRGVVTGPNLAREVLAGHATAAVAVSSDLKTAIAAQNALSVPSFRLYLNPDVIGAELGGALKNVIALAAGMAEGLGMGDNTRATVITRGLAELTRLGLAMGGRPETLAGLAGMGDLIATSISPHSRNRFVGRELGKGLDLGEIIEGMSQVAEGVHTAGVIMELAKRHSVEMPISAAVYSVITGENTAEEAYEELLRREIRAELDW